MRWSARWWASSCLSSSLPWPPRRIAIVGVNPVSGMTLITVVLTILALVATGLTGTGGMFIALIGRLRRLHRAVHVRRAHLGFQDRLLDRFDASQPGAFGSSPASSWRRSWWLL